MLSIAFSFLRMIATAKKGGTFTVYSPRFSYQGMHGTFDAKVLTGMKDIKGKDGPPSVDATVKDGAGAAPDAELFDVEYTMQTGATRYAPMQPVPPTKVSKRDATPQHPTSSVDIARAFLPIPKIQTTVTQSQTHKVTSVVNTVRNDCGYVEIAAPRLSHWSRQSCVYLDYRTQANSNLRLLQLPCHPTIWLNSLRGGKIEVGQLLIRSTVAF
jgi:hypothetical protein